MNLPLPARQLTLEEIRHYMGDDAVVARLFDRIDQLARELECLDFEAPAERFDSLYPMEENRNA